jgi:hypothetical protein
VTKIQLIDKPRNRVRRQGRRRMENHRHLTNALGNCRNCKSPFFRSPLIFLQRRDKSALLDLFDVGWIDDQVWIGLFCLWVLIRKYIQCGLDNLQRGVGTVSSPAFVYS